MIGALWFYGIRSARNKIVKRTRDVRYLVGIVLVFAYLFFVFGRSLGHGSTGGPPSVLAHVVLLFLVGSSLLTWWIQEPDHPLALSKPQSQFLIPAPLTSRQVMLFKLLTSLPTLVWGAIVMGLVFRSGFSPHPTQRILTAFAIILALQLQRVGAALARTPPRTSRRSIVVGIARVWLAAATAVALAQIASVAANKGLFGLQEFASSLAVANQFPFSLLVWPFHALLAPAHAQNLPSFASAIAISLLIVVIEAALVFRIEPRWDQIGIARTRAEKLRERRPGKKSQASEESFWEPYIISLVKRPAAAITWKNLVATKRLQTMRPAFIMAIGVPIILGATLFPAWRHLTSFATGISGAWAGLLLFAGPQFVRNDLRLDLPRLRLLRTYPLTSREICAAEVGASVALLLVLQYVMLIPSATALVFNPQLSLGPARKLAIAIAIACLLPGMTAINVAGQNLFAVVFPKWTTLGTKRPSRSANPGQAYFALLTSAIVFLLSMIVPAIAAAAIAYAVSPLGTSAAIISAAVVAGAVALAEAALSLRWMATLFDRVDLAAVTGESSG